MKTEILIPMWPNQTATSDKLGCGTRYRDLSSCDSFWVPLRARPVGEGYEFADACSIWSELAIYVWMSEDYGVSLELKAYNVHSADLRKLELLTKTLKWATKRLDGIDKVTLGNLPFKLVEICQRLGIKRAIQYRGAGIADVLVPVGEVLQLINAEVVTSFNRLRKAA